MQVFATTKCQIIEPKISVINLHRQQTPIPPVGHALGLGVARPVVPGAGGALPVLELDDLENAVLFRSGGSLQVAMSGHVMSRSKFKIVQKSSIKAQ